MEGTYNYCELPGFEYVHLQDRLVLGIEVGEHEAAFQLDLVLTDPHPRYHPPSPGEQHSYVNARLVVVSAERLVLLASGRPPAIDQDGEEDFGNIDSLLWGETGFEVIGSWGRVAS